MIGFAFQKFFAAVAMALHSYGAYVTGPATDSVLFIHLTEDHQVAVAELDGSKKVVRSDTPLLRVSEFADSVRAARGADGVYVVVSSKHNGDEPVLLFRLRDGKLDAPPVEIGHGANADVVASPTSKHVVTTFFEDRPPNEPMHGMKLGPPLSAMHVQVRASDSLALQGFRMFRGRNDKLLDATVPMLPGVVTKHARLVGRERVTLDLPARGPRRRVVATLPRLQIVDDRDGPAFGDLPGDTDSSVVRSDDVSEPVSDP